GIARVDGTGCGAGPGRHARWHSGTMRIAILGMGNMGRAFAARALETGHQTTVWNRSPGRAQALVADGAVEARSPARAGDRAGGRVCGSGRGRAALGVCFGPAGVLRSFGPASLFASVGT